LSKVGVVPDFVHQLLILIHKDLSADIFLNDFPVTIEIIAKRDLEKGEGVGQNDIADIKRLQFPLIQITDTDKVVFCFKKGWKFGLFFDLHRVQNLDIDKMSLAIGKLYRYLAFQYVYQVLENSAQYQEMIQDGWFPFIDIIGVEYISLAKAYQNKFDFENRIRDIVAIFDGARIERITNKWWRKQVFNDKKEILQAGINAFIRSDGEGYINCISTLLPQVEGIVRLQYFSDTKEGKDIPILKLLKFLIEKGRTKTGSDDSLFLPLPFLNYLKDIVFARFDLEASQIKLSRHSTSHGVVTADSYTRIKALQTILVLDQVYFYI
jgi:hypothetical protein